MQSSNGKSTFLPSDGLMAKVMLVRAGQKGITLAEPVMTSPAMLHTELVKMKTKYEFVEGECVFIDCIDRWCICSCGSRFQLHRVRVGTSLAPRQQCCGAVVLSPCPRKY